MQTQQHRGPSTQPPAAPKAPPVPAAAQPTLTTEPQAYPLGLVAALWSAWIAGSSIGLMGHPLRNALAWTALAAAAVLLFRRAGGAAMAAWMVGVVASGVLLASHNPHLQVLAPAALCAAVAITAHTTALRRQLTAVAAAIALLGLFRYANTSIPWFWLGADRVASLVGRAGGLVAGSRLSVGVTFAGLDFLIPMLAMIAIWCSRDPLPRAGRAAGALAAIVAGHLAYLAVLAHSPSLLALLPPFEPKQPNFWPDTIRIVVPWDVPVLAAMIHGLILFAMLKWLPWWDAEAAPSAGVIVKPPREGLLPPLLNWALLPVAVLLPVLTHHWPRTPGVAGKKIVAYEKGFLNWLRPTHGDYGRLAAGMYGTLPDYIQSLGGTFVKSPELSEQDLKDAAVLMIIFPDHPWTAEQRERIGRFVEGGGTLLVLGDHTTHYPEHYGNKPVENDVGANPFNDLLTGTSMRVRFDSALFAVGGWLQSYEPIAHPSQEGIGDDRNTFGVVTGASVETHFPARPVLVGRFGWNDPGDEGSAAAMMGNHRYDPGERLGDMILVSEQPVGRGKVVVFGDTSSFTNNITYGAHPYTSRMFAYCADGSWSAHSAGSQVVAMVLAAFAAALLLVRPHPTAVIGFCLTLGLCAAVCSARTARAQQQFPATREGAPSRIACIDASHLEAYGSEAIRPDGLMGLVYTLERNGYLPLSLQQDFSPERLKGASLLISIAPARAFTREERDTVQQFIRDGGTFISMVGYDRLDGSRELLADLGLFVDEMPPDPKRAAPQPMGHFKSPYLQNGKYTAYVRFWAAWPVRSNDPDAKVIANGRQDQRAIILRKIGKGKAVLIGDTGFAEMKNLEREDGTLIEGARENADFWRWFLPYLREDPDGWIPAPPPPINGIPDIFILPKGTFTAPPPARKGGEP